MEGLSGVPEIEYQTFKNMVNFEKEKARQLEEEILPKKDTRDTIWEQVCGLTIADETQWMDRTKLLIDQVYQPLKNIFLL
jgi:hypothetical protein